MLSNRTPAGRRGRGTAQEAYVGLQGIECVLLPLKGKQPDFMDPKGFTPFSDENAAQPFLKFVW